MEKQLGYVNLDTLMGLKSIYIICDCERIEHHSKT
jgi:hypothetical protein